MHIWGEGDGLRSVLSVSKSSRLTAVFSLGPRPPTDTSACHPAMVGVEGTFGEVQVIEIHNSVE